MNLENSRTLQNLVNAFAGESQARNRYTIYSKIAQKEGYEEVSNVFLETAENEREHGKLFYKLIPNSPHLKVDGEYPFFIGKTYDNLVAASSGEREEADILYKHASNIAKEEGFHDISALFYNISRIEERHSNRFKLLAEVFENNGIFSKDKDVTWICLKCGHTYVGKDAPKICPVCSHPQAYFTILSEQF